MTTTRRLILITAVLLGFAAGVGTALTTGIGLGQIGDIWFVMIVSGVLGLVSSITTAIATASALTELASSRLNSEQRGSHRSDASGRDFLGISSSKLQQSSGNDQVVRMNRVTSENRDGAHPPA
jgi:hypothetical protein